MLRMCANWHEPIIFDGEKEECPLCKAIDDYEVSEEMYKELKERILKKTHTEGACTEKIELDP